MDRLLVRPECTSNFTETDKQTGMPFMMYYVGKQYDTKTTNHKITKKYYDLYNVFCVKFVIFEFSNLSVVYLNRWPT